MHRLRQLAPLLFLSVAACRGPQRSFTIPICSAMGGDCRCPIAEWVICHDVCVDPAVSIDNCGGCDHGCSSGQVCLAGQCGTDCGGATRCGDACAFTARDPWNCGACGQVCEGVCRAGKCVPNAPGCAAGLTRCNLGCTDLDHDPANCGDCGVECPGISQCFVDASDQHKCCSGTLCGHECYPVGASCP
jgi:hypothetical protein